MSLRLSTAFFLMYMPVTLFAQAMEPEGRMVQGGKLKLYSQIYKSEGLSETPVLMVVLHGDAPFNKPYYQYAFATRAAASNSNLIAAALLRPGYTDRDGNRSEGVRGMTTGDNWNAGNTDAIAAVIELLAKEYQTGHVIVVGHSGGAALTANMLGRHPSLINTALLVALPSDLDAWRKHMLDHKKSKIFAKPIESLSALELVAKVDPKTKIHLIVGAQDEITPPWLSERYQEQAIKHGKRVELTILPGKGHDILLEQPVFERLSTLLKSR